MIVIDTHILVWINLNPDKIPKSILNAIYSEKQLGVAAITLWEIAMLVQKNRLKLSVPVSEWLEEALSQDKIVLLPITPEIAVLSAGLKMHGDPADRLISATALAHNCKLATVDGELLASGWLDTIQ